MSAVHAAPSPGLATTSAVAAEVGVTRRTILNWYKNGKISGEDISSRLVLVSIADAKQQVKRMRNRPKATPHPSP